MQLEVRVMASAEPCIWRLRGSILTGSMELRIVFVRSLPVKLDCIVCIREDLSQQLFLFFSAGKVDVHRNRALASNSRRIIR
jgi:hypothetical protein